MTPLESRSLVRGGVLLLGLSVLRLALTSLPPSGPVVPDGDSNLSRLLEESLDLKAQEERRSRRLAPGEALDPNRSDEEELDRLPGIGPATAKAWVETRDRIGGFWREGDLLQVPGVGPATVAKISPHLDFSRGVPLTTPNLRKSADSTPGPTTGGGRSGIPTSRGSPADFSERIDLNKASSEELQSLPGIGPALAERILESRRREGSFLSPEALLRVRGIGPATLEKIRELILPRG